MVVVNLEVTFLFGVVTNTGQTQILVLSPGCPLRSLEFFKIFPPEIGLYWSQMGPGKPDLFIFFTFRLAVYLKIIPNLQKKFQEDSLIFKFCHIWFIICNNYVLSSTILRKVAYTLHDSLPPNSSAFPKNKNVLYQNNSAVIKVKPNIRIVLYDASFNSK